MKIVFKAHGFSDDKTIAENEGYAKTLGFPRLGKAKGPLAVVGGGPSILGKVDELRAFDGEIWAINGTWNWLRERGIDAVFFTVDQHPKIADMAKGANRAILAMCCAPCVFDALEGADIEAVLVGGEHGTPTGVTSATAAAYIAILKGHTSITYYGCESSFDEVEHAYQEAKSREIIQVECGGEVFTTKPALMMQVEHLGEQIAAAPEIFKQRGGGLLEAYLKTPDIDVIAGSQSLHDRIYAT